MLSIQEKDNMAQTKTGETVDADLNKDFVNDLPIEETIWKYIEKIIDFDDNGAIINNIKHLRGATMRMLTRDKRSNLNSIF